MSDSLARFGSWSRPCERPFTCPFSGSWPARTGSPRWASSPRPGRWPPCSGIPSSPSQNNAWLKRRTASARRGGLHVAGQRVVTYEWGDRDGPATMLPANPVLIENVEPGRCTDYWHRENTVEDVLLFRDLARSDQSAATLLAATNGNRARGAYTPGRGHRVSGPPRSGDRDRHCP